MKKLKQMIEEIHEKEYAEMHELDRVINFFEEHKLDCSEERITKLYGKISNPRLRVNSKDKQWVAYKTQASENTTVVDAIEEIMNNDIDWILLEKSDKERRNNIKKVVDKVGKIFENKLLTHKPRIPFYILVLDKLV